MEFLNLLSQQDLITVGIQLASVWTLLFCVFFVCFLVQRMCSSLLKNQHVKNVISSIVKKGSIVLVVVGIISSLALLGYDSYLFVNKLDIYDHTIGKVREIPMSFWTAIGIGLLSLLGYYLATRFILKQIRKIISFCQEKVVALEFFKHSHNRIVKCFHQLQRIITTAVYILFFTFATSALALPKMVTSFLFLACRIYLVVAVAFFATNLMSTVIERLEALSVKRITKDSYLQYYQQLRGLIPLFQRCLELALYMLTANLVLRQIQYVEQFATLGIQAALVIGVFFASRVVIEIANLLLEQTLLKSDSLSLEELQRRKTLVPLVKSLARYCIQFAAIIVVLAIFDFDPTPILAGAGVLGLVVGLGAQSIINDLLSGFFILFENLFLVGDYVRTSEAEGIVEEVDIRTTRIRSQDGQVYIIRNGQLGTVINYSKSHTYAIVEVGVSYDSDLAKVTAVLVEAGKTLLSKSQDVIEVPEVQGLQNFGESDLVLRVRTKVRPGKHLIVARAYRQLIKEYFDRHEIEIPFARRVLILQNEQIAQELSPEVELQTAV